MKKGVLYARVSSKDQAEEGYSIDAQIRRISTYADLHQIEIVERYVEQETAKVAGRHLFDSMVRFLKRHRDHIVLVEKTDRLYRNIKDWVTMDELGSEIHFVHENEVISPDSRSSQKFMHGIKVLIAKNYIDNLGEETSKGMREKAEKGLWPSYAPPGYLNDKETKLIIPDPKDAPICAENF